MYNIQFYKSLESSLLLQLNVHSATLKNWNMGFEEVFRFKQRTWPCGSNKTFWQQNWSLNANWTWYVFVSDVYVLGQSAVMVLTISQKIAILHIKHEFLSYKKTTYFYWWNIRISCCLLSANVISSISSTHLDIHVWGYRWKKSYDSSDSILVVWLDLSCQMNSLPHDFTLFFKSLLFIFTARHY